MNILYDMFKDASRKLRDASEEDGILLLDTVVSLVEEVSMIVRNDGLLELDEAVKGMESNYLKMLAELIVDGATPEMVLEFGTNVYWIQNPQGICAMVYYVSLRGMLYIQEGINTKLMATLLRTLLPEKWHLEYYRRLDYVFDDTLRYKKIKERFLSIYPIFEKEILPKRISVLETKVKKMNAESIQRSLQEMGNDMLAKCLYGFGKEAREKIVDNLSEKLGCMIMEDTIYFAEGEVKEKELLEAVDATNDIIDRLHKNLEGENRMQVSIYSRETVTKLLQSDFPANVAVISFYDPSSAYSDPPVDYSAKTKRVFAIAIHDIDLSVLPEYHLTYDTYFPEADKLAEFIYEAKSEELDIICQCEYGESRSSGCAAAIREHFYGDGISIFVDYRYYPNQVIYHKVFDALEKLAAERKG